MKKKIIRRKSIESLADVFSDIHPVLQRIYSTRGIKSKEELDHQFSQLLAFDQLLNIDKAVACLVTALKDQQRILVIGDFDADGATSTALAVRALKSFGAKHVNYLVPNRFSFGYGITPELVAIAKEMNPNVIITVDNGIANHSGVLAAKELGIKVIITDHHLAPTSLPDADAIVNPNQPGCLFPSKQIAGVGVIFYVMLALRRSLCDQNWFSEQHIEEPVMSRLLDLVALGTVADVVPLDHNNRILVAQGLKRIRAKQCSPGILALLEKVNKDPAKIIASDLGFVVAPRLNAAGRLDDMSLGIECLLCDDLQRAREMAKTLDRLNEERREIEQSMQTSAIKFLKKHQLNENKLPKGICLFEEEWHQGVIGILASRIKDQLQRPVIAFALGNQDELKGSARSIPNLHIRDTLAVISTKYPNLIIKFGGHAMAAGLTISKASFKDFSKIFDEVVATQLTDDDFEYKILTDGELTPNELNLDLASNIREASPWGQSFPEPLFDGVFSLIDQRLVGGKHLKMTVGSGENSFDAIAFNVNLVEWPNYRLEYVKIVYKLDVNEYKGRRKVQLIVEYLEPL